MRNHLPLFLAVFVLGCRAQPAPVSRRVPVDLIGDCIALRQRLCECGEDAVPVLLKRRAAQKGQPAADPASEEAAREEVRAELRREVELSDDERLQQCRVATAETAPPEPEDVARLHRCLNLPCPRRAACLQPLLLPPSGSRPPAAGPRSPLG